MRQLVFHSWNGVMNKCQSTKTHSRYKRSSYGFTSSRLDVVYNVFSMYR